MVEHTRYGTAVLFTKSYFPRHDRYFCASSPHSVGSCPFAKLAQAAQPPTRRL